MIDIVRRRLSLAGLLLPAACASPQFVQAPSAQVPSPRVRIGDRWRYRELDGYNGRLRGEVAAGVAGLSPLRVSLRDASGAARADEVYQDPWRIVQEPIYGLVQVFQTPVPIVPVTIAAGVADRMGTYYTVPERSARFWWSQWLHAPGWERVRVPAGEFDCLRIERRISFQYAEIFRELPERYDVAWYSPQVNRWVRREWQGWYYLPGPRRARLDEDRVIWELTEYLPAATS